MALIDASYFVGDIDIPNIEQSPNTIEQSIEKYEKEVLIFLLGYQLYDAFKTGLKTMPIASKWVELRDGADFILKWNGHDVRLRWEGLVNTEKTSLIAYYVYYKIRYDQLSTTTSIGEVRGKVENSFLVNETRKMLSAWRRFLNLYGELIYSESRINYHYRYSKVHHVYYFEKYSDSYDMYNDMPSAYNFINTNREDYSDWTFTPQLDQNEFGL